MCLRVKVNDGHLLPRSRKGGGGIDHCRRFAYAAFLIQDRNYSHYVF